MLAGHKRPLHTIIPAFASKGEVRIAFGIMGGWNQSQAHAQFVSDVVDHQMNIQAALEAPRFTKQTFAGRDVEMESRVPAAVRAELTARGHQIELRGTYAASVGGGPGGAAGFCGGRQLRGVRSAQRRRGHPANHAGPVRVNLDDAVEST